MLWNRQLSAKISGKIIGSKEPGPGAGGTPFIQDCLEDFYKVGLNQQSGRKPTVNPSFFVQV